MRLRAGWRRPRRRLRVLWPVGALVVLALVAAWAVPGGSGRRGSPVGTDVGIPVPRSPSLDPPVPTSCPSAGHAASKTSRAERAAGAPAGFPGAGDTGSRPGLPTDRTQTVLDEPGTVVEGVTLEGQVTIEADDVTLRDVTVRSGSAYGVLVAGSRALLEDVTVVGGDPSPTMAGIAALDGASFTARRVDVSHVEDGVRLGDESRLEDSYVHDLCGSPDAHFDGVVAEARTRWEIRGNTIINANSQTSAVSIGLRASDGLVTGNYLSGGGYTLYAGPRTGTDLTVSGNVFSTRLQPRGGYYGPVAYWGRTANAWQGNVWADGSRAGSRVEP